MTFAASSSRDTGSFPTDNGAVLGDDDDDRLLGFERLARCLALGKFTLMPVASIGAVTMKMIKRTSITSTSGVTLISASG